MFFFLLQRLGGENNSPKSEDAAMKSPPLPETNVEPKVSPRGGSQTPEVRLLKDAMNTKDKKETKNVSGLIRNIQNETKSDIKLEKSVKTGEWDMFADQDNFDNVDVSSQHVPRLKRLSYFSSNIEIKFLFVLDTDSWKA